MSNIQSKWIRVIILATVAAAALFGGKQLHDMRGTKRPVAPEVLDVQQRRVTIAWETEMPGKGEIVVVRAGSSETPVPIYDPVERSPRHEVVVQELEPGTRYTYRIVGSNARFQFQTQPPPTTPFSFLVVAGDAVAGLPDMVSSEMVEFILSLDPTSDTSADPFRRARPYVPIYGPQGPLSPFLAGFEHRAKPPAPCWNLDWGGLRLIVCNDFGALLPDALVSASAHTVGIVLFDWHTVFPIARQHDGFPSEKDIRLTELHRLIRNHNAQHTDAPAAFVVLPGARRDDLNADGVRYVGIPIPGSKEPSAAVQSVRFDVDVDSTRCVFLKDPKEIVLREPPLERKLTCRECRRLADSGAYEKSVRAYETFVENNAGHYQIDDAYFAAGEILVEKLFRFEDARKWYARLLSDYPGSSLAPLARQRIAYLARYSDFDYAPLARFERIRKVEFARKRHDPQETESLLKEVGAIIEDYPQARIAPVMQHWLAIQYRDLDPDRAARLFRELARRFPDSEEAGDALFQVGETYYLAGRFRDAETGYRAALQARPEMAETVAPQIRRCLRNLRRTVFSRIAWVLFALPLAAFILSRPWGFVRRRLGLISLCGLTQFALYASIAWLIREQFSSSAEMIMLTAGFAAAFTVGATVSSRWVGTWCRVADGRSLGLRRLLAVPAGTALGFVMVAAATYLTLFYVHVHYLIILGL